jgi:hypothetical protein
MKCPKCLTRIRHHADGTIELLTVGQPPPPPAAAPGAPPPGPPAPSEETPVAAVPLMVEKLVAQSESRQNLYVGVGLAAVLTLVLSGLGLLMGYPILVVAPPAVALVAAFIALAVRARRRAAREPAPRSRSMEEGKTEPLPKI